MVKKAKKVKKATKVSEDYRLSCDAIMKSTGLLDKRKVEEVRKNIYGDDEESYWEVVVVTLDIRRSSIALVNVEDFEEYSNVITDYVCYVMKTCQSKDYPCEGEGAKSTGENGWFDKFTGDGVIVFWRLPDEPYFEADYDEKLKRYYQEWNKTIKSAIEFSIEVTRGFLEVALPDIRKTCGLLPTDFGLSVGIDAGECLLTELRPSRKCEDRFVKFGREREYNEGLEPVCPTVTAIGRAIIGANRMVEKAKPYEIIVNSYPGAKLKAALDDPKDKVRQGVKFSLEPTCVCTKEYNPIEAYRVVSGHLEHLKRTNTFCQVKEVKKEKSEEKVKQISNQKDMESKKEDEG